MSEIITTENGSKIEIFDNLFTFAERINFYNFVRSSLYRTDGSDLTGDPNARQLHSSFSVQDLNNMGFLKSANVQKYVLNNYEISEITKIRANLSNCFEYNVPHPDMCDLTFLYYVNLEWNISWAGQTLFLNETLNRVEYCSLYTPGRLIVFKGRIPHMIVSPTIFAKQHRYTLVIQTKGNSNV